MNFTSLIAYDHRALWGAEADYVWRLRPAFHPVTWEVLAGARYFRFDESFAVLGSGGVLDSSFWNTRSINNMGGGQIGLRFAHRRNRLMFTTEGRFTALANWQNNLQQGEIASNTVAGTPDGPRKVAELAAHRLEHRRSKDRVLALGRIRFNLQYQVFNKASVNLGWTGIIVGGVARPADMINYQLPNMGILVHGNNKQTVLMQGLTVGLIFNR